MQSTKVQRLAWYATHFPRMQHKNLIPLATNPKREILDINERIVAVLLILKDGIQSNEEVKPLLDLVKDEEDFPICIFIEKDEIDRYKNHKLIDGQTKEKIDKKENNALLRGDASIALANYGLKSAEFVNALIDILNNIACDPLFIYKSNVTDYLVNFLAALYKADTKSAVPFMDTFSIKVADIERHLTPPKN